MANQFAKIATILGQGKPIIQRLGDLRRGRRSNNWRLQKSTFSPTLKDVTPGNIAMVLPHRILTDIMEGLEKLNEVIPGVATDSTFLYAPEIKFYSMKICVNDNMETSVKNLFVRRRRCRFEPLILSRRRQPAFWRPVVF